MRDRKVVVPIARALPGPICPCRVKWREVRARNTYDTPGNHFLFCCHAKPKEQIITLHLPPCLFHARAFATQAGAPHASLDLAGHQLGPSGALRGLR